MVNRDTHIQPRQRRVTQDLLNAIKSLGDPNESVEKEDFQDWIVQNLNTERLEDGEIDIVMRSLESARSYTTNEGGDTDRMVSDVSESPEK